MMVLMSCISKNSFRSLIKETIPSPESDSAAEETIVKLRKEVSRAPLEEKSVSKGKSAEVVPKTDKEEEYLLPGIPPAVEPREKTPASPPQRQQVKAGAHDDNEEFAYYLNFLERYPNLQGIQKLNTAERYILRVVDKNGLSVPFADVRIPVDENRTWEAKTYANGETLLFPGIAFPDRKINLEQLPVQVEYQGEIHKLPFTKNKDGIVELSLPSTRQIQPSPAIDIVFLLDTTGSMGDEIDNLKDVIFAIHSRIIRLPGQPVVRFGMVLYRDRGDEYVTQSYPLTSDVDEFQKSLNGVSARGGGDTPEDLQAGLFLAVEQMSWKKDSIKLIFLLADAPPHTDYTDEKDYITTMKKAQREGIKICTIGASGLETVGEYVFRQLSIYTYGQFIFLTYGETGESDGKGEPGKVSHHTGSNYQVKNLDDLVVDIVRRDLSYISEPGTISPVVSKPVEEKDHLEIRIDNLLQQVHMQMQEVSKELLIGIIATFDYNKNELKDLAEYLGDLASEILLKEKWMKLVERKKLEEVLKEHKMELTGLIDSKSTSRLGKFLEANILLYGKLYYLGTDRVLHIRAIDITTSEIVASARVRM